MGGSLGLAVKRAKLAQIVCGYARREQTRSDAIRLKAVDKVFDRPEDAARNADTVVFCLPVLAIPQLAEACRPAFSAGCVVTDVGSTKAGLTAELGRILKDSRIPFVGSHPITGSEETGLQAARANLYEGAVAVVTSLPDTPGDALERVARFWQGLKMEVLVMSPEEHDNIVARTSHLPHLVAAMLVSSVLRGDSEKARKFCGPGFRDTTRIAAGSEDIWHDIVKSNRAPVARELDEFGKALERAKAMVSKGDFDALRHFLAESREKRRGLSR